MIIRQLERVRRARMPEHLVVATSVDPSDDELTRAVEGSGFEVFRGDLDDVLGRFAGVCARHLPRHVVRLTGDCPLTDPDLIDAIIAHHLVRGADITSNSNEPTFPDGLDVEVVRADCLHQAAAEASHRFEREHVTQFFYRRPDRFRIEHYKSEQDLSRLRWTVDEPADLEFVRAVYDALFRITPEFGMRDILALLQQRPELSAINAAVARNEGLSRSIGAEFGAQCRGALT